MKILENKLKERFAQLTNQNHGKEDPTVIAHFYSKDRDWYATEYYPDDKIFYGYIKNPKEEREYDGWSSFYIQELELEQDQKDFQMDLFFIERPISQVVPELAFKIELQRELRQLEKLKRLLDKREKNLELDHEL